MSGRELDKGQAAISIMLIWGWIPVLAIVLATMTPGSAGFWVTVFTMLTFAAAGGIVLGQVANG